MHSTNYFNTFITVAEDCPAESGQVPPEKTGTPSVAVFQFDLLIRRPYELTSDDVIFQTYAVRNGIPLSEWKRARADFFSKGQACLRASPLTKRYGWGVHSNEEGKVALYACDSDEYRRLSGDDSLKQVKAMRSKRG